MSFLMGVLVALFARIAALLNIVSVGALARKVKDSDE